MKKFPVITIKKEKQLRKPSQDIPVWKNTSKYLKWLNKIAYIGSKLPAVIKTINDFRRDKFYCILKRQQTEYTTNTIL